ncbi:MAG: Rnase Y domain-containing protein, partial [Anaerolineales bacterium]
MDILIVGLIALLVGGVAGSTLYNTIQARRGKDHIRQAEEQANTEAKKERQQEQAEHERNLKKRRDEVEREETRLQRRRESLDDKQEKLEKRETNLGKQQSQIDKRRNEIENMYNQRVADLTRIAEMSRDEARQELLAAVEEDTRTEMARRIRVVEEEMQEEADKRARDIISLAVQRMASDTISEIAVSVVTLPSDEMKGRIIGRAGRNIRAFEQATGVDVIVDDTPEAVTLSSFDPVRREVAKRTMAKLVLDGRIHPARIEKLVEETRREIDRVIREEGERAAYEASVPGLHPEIMKLLGRLKFRTSFGQNQLSHSVETANLAGMIASELGADVPVAR